LLFLTLAVIDLLAASETDPARERDKARNKRG
jgi:hypothetical protein